MIDVQLFTQMTNQEKYDLLKPMPVTVANHQVMDGSKKVGDPTAVRMKYRSMIQNIALSGWEESPELAMEKGRSNLEDLNTPEDPKS